MTQAQRPLTHPRRRALLVMLGLALLALSPPLAAAATARASLTDIENDVMCVSCRESLAVAQSPQSYAERNYIRTLIGQGETKSQIEQALVGQYGPAVLGKPPASGFNLTIYVLPPAILVLGIAVLAVALPRWRRRTRATEPPAGPAATGPAATGPAATGPAVSSVEAARLDQELARFDG
jgi:cytochrome c-type biogenesis protein CcmH